MEIETIKINEIQPSKYNPRYISENEKEKLIKSLKTFGLVDPIIINNKNNEIIGGHQRYEALKEIYDEKTTELKKINLGNISWVFNSTEINIQNDNQVKMLNLALNKISGGWDNDKLESLLQELNTEDIDLTLTGFDTFEIDNLINTENFEGIDDELINRNIETAFDSIFQGVQDRKKLLDEQGTETYRITLFSSDYDLFSKFLNYIGAKEGLKKDKNRTSQIEDLECLIELVTE